MSKSNFTEEFKRDAVRQITERGYPVAEVSQRLGVSQHSLYEWKKKFAASNAKGNDEAEEIRRVSSCPGNTAFSLWSMKAMAWTRTR